MRMTRPYHFEMDPVTVWHNKKIMRKMACIGCARNAPKVCSNSGVGKLFKLGTVFTNGEKRNCTHYQSMKTAAALCGNHTIAING